MQVIEEDFWIQREAHRIDLLIRSEGGKNQGQDEEAVSTDWAIIIENKLNAPLYNDLEKYWKAVTATRKFGIVLSLHPVGPNLLPNTQGMRFINLLHKDLIEGVKKRLGAYFLEANDRHLLSLKEYITNIESFYKRVMEQDEFSEKLNAFQKEGEHLLQLYDLKARLHNEMGQTFFRVMEKYGWIPASTATNVNTKHFYPVVEGYPNEENKPQWMRFWVDFHHLLHVNKLGLNLELYGEGTEYGAQLRKKIHDEDLRNGTNLEYGERGAQGGAWIYLTFPTSALDQKKTLKNG